MKSYYPKLLKYGGIAVSLFAIVFVVRTANGAALRTTLSSVQLPWLLPVILINAVVIFTKAFRWQVLVRPLMEVGFFRMVTILTVGFMANNVLPARLGEAVRVHLLHRKTDLGHATTAGSLIADKILEGLSFLLLTLLLLFLDGVPPWMGYGIAVTALATIGAYIGVILYARSHPKQRVFIKLQEGLAPLHHPKVFIVGMAVSLASWLMQLGMIYLCQRAFGVHIPFWSTMLVLVAVNLAVIIPSAPANIGTFELACVLTYTFLGVDKDVGLLVGAAYHLLQVLPVTLIGALLLLAGEYRVWRGAAAADPDEAYYR